MTAGLDYSAGVIRGSAIKAANYQFVIRYIGTPGRTKNITRSEYLDLTYNRITVWLVYENSVNDILGGYNGGVTAARLARADANTIGYPTGAPIFFCADRHLTATEVPIGVQYILGAASMIGHNSTGAYGFSEFIRGVQARQAARLYWQCGSRSAVLPGVHIYQRNNAVVSIGGVACDIDDLLVPIALPGAPTIPTPPKRHPQEDAMYIFKGDGKAPTTLMGILSGPIFVQLFSPGEKSSALDAVLRQGATVQYVEQSTWDALAKASAGLCANPRMVQQQSP